MAMTPPPARVAPVAHTYGSLFSGVGGFDLGMDRAGMRCLWQVEIDAAARSVLTRHWPDVPKFADVRDVGAHNLAPVDVITFGSPCQDLSVAGKRAGMVGERSGLFYEAIRIIRELRPTIAVWENVCGALSSAQGRDFGAAIDALADAGALDICWRVLDAQWFGVAQRRRRVFTVADFRAERAAEILFESDGMPGHSEARREAGQDVAGTIGGSSQSGGFRTTDLDNNGAFVPLARSQTTREGARLDGESCTFVPMTFDWQKGNDKNNPRPSTMNVAIDQAQTVGSTRVPAVAFAENQRAEVRTSDIALNITNGGGGSDKPHVLAFQSSQSGVRQVEHAPTLDSHNGSRRQNGVVTSMAVRRLTPTECERLQGFPDGHTAGQADSSRYRQLGNAVAVPCSEWIAKRIVSAL